MEHGQDLTHLVDANLANYHETEGSSESLAINCVEPQAYPGDTDGDGGPDAREQGLNYAMGGMRNFLSPWDYFNPTHDGVNRIDDMNLVRMYYGLDQGVSPYYTPDVDRSYVGPNPWNLGPPDGTVRINDIV